MKRITTVLFLALTMGIFISCEKEEQDKQEEVGAISGMGNAAGELQVKAPFEFPEGIELVGGEIRGMDIGSSAQAIGEGSEVLKSSSFNQFFGSGGHWIALELVLRNLTGSDLDFFIPAGSVFEAQESGYQHGILLKEIRIKVLGNNQIQVKLYLMCLNYGKTGSKKVITYKLKGVSTSQWIGRLTDALKYEKINFEEFDQDEIEEYNRITRGLQDIVWAITNAYGVNDKDWDFIDALRDVLEGN